MKKYWLIEEDKNVRIFEKNTVRNYIKDRNFDITDCEKMKLNRRQS